MLILRFLFLLPLLFFSCTTSEKSREWKVAIDPTWYPLNLGGREKNLTGFAIDLLKEVSIEKKLKLSLVREDWSNLLRNLDKKKYEAILSSLQPYIFYENRYDFSEPFLLIGPVLIMPRDSDVTSLEELSGKEIAILEGSADALVLEKYPGIIIRTYSSIPDALNAMIATRVDGAICGRLEATAYTQDLYAGKLKIVTPPLNDRGLRLVTLHEKGNILIEAINSTVDILKKSGKYDELAKKWSLPEK